MLIISFDAVGDSEFERLLEYPAFSGFTGSAAVFREVSSVFVSNTYPVHTSVATGAVPGVHGVSANTDPFPAPHPVWNTREDTIRIKTFWQEAAERGITSAAVFWPVTAYSKSIRWNIPEVLARPGKSQILTSLRAGSAIQLSMFLRHRGLLRGIGQPFLDNFAAAAMADILREKKPGLALVHLSAYDGFCHKYGKKSPEINTAFEALDRNLGILLDAAGERPVIIFSDHSQIDAHTILDPNAMLAEAGFIRRENGLYQNGEYACYFECAGGSAFFHQGSIPLGQIHTVKENIRGSRGFRRFLTVDELKEAGRESTAFGFSAEAGFVYGAFDKGEKANHGYPLDMPDYKVFFMARGFGLKAGSTSRGKSLLDIAPLVRRQLGISPIGGR